MTDTVILNRLHTFLRDKRQVLIGLRQVSTDRDARVSASAKLELIAEISYLLLGNDATKDNATTTKGAGV